MLGFDFFRSQADRNTRSLAVRPETRMTATALKLKSTPLNTPEGTVIDDLLVYRFAEDHLLLVVNAGTTDKDWDWISSHRENEDIELGNVSADYCQLALQGPDALGILQKLTRVPLSEIKYYHFREGEVDGVPAIVSRTGYT